MRVTELQNISGWKRPIRVFEWAGVDLASGNFGSLINSQTCSWKQIMLWMLAPECHPGCVFSRPCVYKVTKSKIQHLIVPTAPLCEQAQPFLVQSSSTRACFLCYLWEVSVMHIHEHPLHLHSPGTLLPTPKDGAEIRNQGKPGSSKWTHLCSINWQQKIARQNENLNNRNIEKYFEWKATNLREVWDVPGDNSSVFLSWLCTIS